MIQTITLGGKERPILCGNWVFRRLKQEMKVTLQDVAGMLSGGDMGLLSDIAYYALRAGEAYNKDTKPEKYTPDDVALWMDAEKGATKKVLDIVTESILSISGEEQANEATDESEKKPTPAQ